MARYRVEAYDQLGACRASGTFRGDDATDAVLHAQREMHPAGTCRYVVYRAGLRRTLVLVASESGPDGEGGDGLAGVREPRRPKPSPGHLTVALNPPT